MNELAPVEWTAANQELARINPYSGWHTLNVGNTYPWLGSSSTGMGVPYPTSRKEIGAFIPTGAPGARLAHFGQCKCKECKCNSSFGKKKTKHRTKKVKLHKKKKHTGWCIKKKKVVKVYKVKGLVGRRYYNNKKVPKRTRCFKTKEAAQRAIGKRKRKYNRKTKKYYWVYDSPYSVRRSYGRSRRANNAENRVNRSYNHGIWRKYDCDRNPNKIWVGPANSNGYCKTRDQSGGAYHGPLGPGGFGKSRFGRVVNPANRLNYQYQQYATNVGTPTVGQMGMISNVPAYSYPVRSGMSNSAWYVPKQNFGGYGF